MPNPVANLDQFSEFALTLKARPPRLVHGVLVVLAVLLGAAVTWAALTKADLVVRAPGRVRPASPSQTVPGPACGEALSAAPGCRVVEVNFRPGQRVRAGDVLVRLDTERLDNEIARKKRIIRNGEEELEKLALLLQLVDTQASVAKAKAQAELEGAKAEVGLARDRKKSEVRVAETELAAADDELARVRRLRPSNAASTWDLVKAQARQGVAAEQLTKARLPVDDSSIAVLGQAVRLAEQEAAVRRKELEIQRALKRGEVDAAQIDLANLELHRREAELRAPMDGVVTAGEVRVGDVLQAGKAVAEIAEAADLLFEALVPTEDMGFVHVGMPARVRLDAYDYQRYGTITGTVSYVAADSTVVEGQKAALYVVRIKLDALEVGRGELIGRVKLGLGGQVEIVTERRSLLAILLSKIRQRISLG